MSDTPRTYECEVVRLRAEVANWGSRYAVAADELEQWKRQAFEMQHGLRHFAERFAEILDRLAAEQEVVAFDKRPPSVIPRTLREVAEAARELAKTECDYDPRTMAGLPIGQFHCPKCGEMVISGMPH